MTGRRATAYDGTVFPGRRIFIAAPIPDAAGAEIARVVERVRALGVPDGGRDVRWVRLDGLHLTLRFLGPTPDPRIEDATRAMQAAAVTSGPFEAELGGTGTFPPSGRPRTLWLGLTDGDERLVGLAREVNAALADAGWPDDGRPFRPHLTLARADGIAAGRLVADRLAGAMADVRVRFGIDRLTLFESVTGGGPARYVPLESTDLTQEHGIGRVVYHRAAPRPD